MRRYTPPSPTLFLLINPFMSLILFSLFLKFKNILATWTCSYVLRISSSKLTKTKNYISNIFNKTVWYFLFVDCYLHIQEQYCQVTLAMERLKIMNQFHNQVISLNKRRFKSITMWFRMYQYLNSCGPKR